MAVEEESIPYIEIVLFVLTVTVVVYSFLWGSWIFIGSVSELNIVENYFYERRPAWKDMGLLVAGNFCLSIIWYNLRKEAVESDA